MAINPSTNPEMTGRVQAPDASYPYGSAQDESSPGAGDGSPYFKARADDIFGFQQALLADAGIVPSGNADTVLDSQYMQAANQLFKVGLKNKFINGDFLVNQKGLSFTGVAGGFYTSDQWRYDTFVDGGVLANNDVDIIDFPTGQTDVPGNPRRFYRQGGNTVGGGGNFINGATNNILDVRTLAGEICTLSFWVRGSANGTIGYVLNQIFGTGGAASAPSVAIPLTDIAVTTAWQKVEIAFLMPTISGSTIGTNEDDRLEFRAVTGVGATQAATWGGTAKDFGANTIDIADVQLEQGAYGTTFDRLPLGLVLGLCRDFYQRYELGELTELGQFTWNGGAQDNMGVTKTLAQPMLETPTATIVTATGNMTNRGNGGINLALSLLNMNVWSPTSYSLTDNGRTEEGTGDSATMQTVGGALFIYEFSAKQF